MKKTIVLISAFCLFSVSLLVAQQELGMHFNTEVWQANITNPAIIPTHKVVIALPSVYSDFSINNQNLTYLDLIARNVASGKSTINLQTLISKWEDKNTIRNATQFDAFGVGFRIKKTFVSFGTAGVINTSFDLSKDLLDVGVNGNSKFIGKTANLTLGIESYIVSQKYLGFAYNINPNLIVATRLKVLSGDIAIASENSDMQLYTDPDIYQLKLTSNYRLKTAGIGDYKGYDKQNGINFNSYLNFGSNAQIKETAIRALAAGTNKGFSFDLGATYQVTSKLRIGVSATDIGGKINWKNNTSTFGHNNIDFKGLDFGVILRGDTNTFNKVMDTLKTTLDLSPTTHDAFTTKLPMRTYLSANYRLNKAVNVSGLFFTESYRGKLNTAFALGLNTTMGWLNLGLSWAYRNGSASNIGLSAVAKMGPIQIFGVTDNIIPAFSLDNSKINYNGRFGINLLFGKPKIKPVATPVIESVPEVPNPPTTTPKN
jgi:Family of unknown function (DUF5723)